MTTTKKTRWGILGTSYISGVMAQAIHASENAELVAIASRSQHSAMTFAEAHAIPIHYGDYHAMLADTSIDAVYIGLPNHLHKEWVMHCSHAKKHSLCEKPFALTANDARDAFAIAQQNGVYSMEALMYRHHPLTTRLKSIIASRELGDTRLVTATYTADIAALANPTAGGAILNLGCYPVSLIRYLLGDEPTRITSIGRLSEQTGNDHSACALLQFNHDVMAVVSTADDIAMSWQFEVHGTKGYLKMVTNPWLPSEVNAFTIHSHGEDAPKEITVTADKPLYTYQIEAMNQMITFGFTHCDVMTPQDSIANAAVLEAWLEHVKQASCLTV